MFEEFEIEPRDLLIEVVNSNVLNFVIIILEYVLVSPFENFVRKLSLDAVQDSPFISLKQKSKIFEF